MGTVAVEVPASAVVVGPDVVPDVFAVLPDSCAIVYVSADSLVSAASDSVLLCAVVIVAGSVAGFCAGVAASDSAAVPGRAVFVFSVVMASVVAVKCFDILPSHKWCKESVTSAVLVDIAEISISL